MPYDIQYVSIRRVDGSGALDPTQSASSRQSPVPEGRRIDGFRATTAIALSLPGGQISLRPVSGRQSAIPREGDVSYRTCLLFRSCVRAGIHVEVHESLCANAGAGRLGRFRREAMTFVKRAHRSTTLYRGRDVHRGGRALCRRFFAPACSWTRPCWARRRPKFTRGLRGALPLATGARARAAAKDQNPV